MTDNHGSIEQWKSNIFIVFHDRQWNNGNQILSMSAMIDNHGCMEQWKSNIVHCSTQPWLSVIADKESIGFSLFYNGEMFRAVKNYNEMFGAVENNSEMFGAVENNSDMFRAVMNNSEMFRL